MSASLFKYSRKIVARSSLIRVTLIRSGAHQKESVRETLKNLGLRKINQSIIHKNNSAIRGMIHRAFHLLSVEEIPIPPELMTKKEKEIS